VVYCVAEHVDECRHAAVYADSLHGAGILETHLPPFLRVLQPIIDFPCECLVILGGEGAAFVQSIGGSAGVRRNSDDGHDSLPERLRDTHSLDLYISAMYRQIGRGSQFAQSLPVIETDDRRVTDNTILIEFICHLGISSQFGSSAG